ncbi:MAG: endolytic transglycosylase MltG [Bacteroidetes bacterium]|nr:endolytic transglycosylase MltG [Bacteroidota bacterium]MBU1719860.1 endolytic transglycosylase MltG [Bacteroidota bacterium]
MPGKRKFRVLRVLIPLVLVGIIVGVILGYSFFQKVYSPNVDLHGKNEAHLYIYTGSTFEDLTDTLEAKKWLKDQSSFIWVANKKKYIDNVKPGKYLIEDGMSNNDLISLLRSGKQVPVKVTFNNIRTKDQLAKQVSKNLEATEAEVFGLLCDRNYISKYNLNSENIMSMFIPNTYEFRWNTSADDFFQRMATEYKKFWTDERKAKAKNAGLSQSEVSALAAIVQEETIKRDEKPKVAGVYINRLHDKWPLQADPTLKFAAGDFTLKRLLDKHKKIDSPYNTYLYPGLPPGPICLPEISSLDAVLNYEKHDYYFFCAKPDFSGYHNFSKSNAQHEQYAKLYHNALNKRKIR